MDVGIGLPNAVPDTEGRTIVDWARRADEAGFSTLGTIGRLVYPNYEELIALAAAAAVTSRIRLTTSILLAPLHTNTALFAKQAASLDRISGGRLVLGLGLGGREDDFAASGLTMARRGQRFDEQLAEMQRIWAGEGRAGIGPIGPMPARPSPAQMRCISANCSSKRCPRRAMVSPLAAKSSSRPPRPRPSTRRPPEMRSSEAACLANSAVFVCSGASRIDVVSRIRLVTAAAAAKAISSS